ncbi:hypothetical protein CJU89_6808 [Yarrowia sp. B02]|nr:hypothetical protein CJU89_6808 [Yarrowia sp. B02]
MDFPNEIVEMIFKYSSVETCVALSQVSRVFRDMFLFSENLLREKLLARCPWMRVNEDGIEIETWGELAYIFTARTRTRNPFLGPWSIEGLFYVEKGPWEHVFGNMVQGRRVIQPPAFMIPDPPEDDIVEIDTTYQFPYAPDFEAIHHRPVAEGEYLEGNKMIITNSDAGVFGGQVSVNLSTLEVNTVADPVLVNNLFRDETTGQVYYMYGNDLVPVPERTVHVTEHPNSREVLFVTGHVFIMVPIKDGRLQIDKKFSFSMTGAYMITQFHDSTFITQASTSSQRIYYINHTTRGLVTILATTNGLFGGNHWEKFALHNGLLWHFQSGNLVPYQVDLQHMDDFGFASVRVRPNWRISCHTHGCPVGPKLLQRQDKLQRYVSLISFPDRVFDLSTRTCYMQRKMANDLSYPHDRYFAGVSDGIIKFWRWRRTTGSFDFPENQERQRL